MYLSAKMEFVNRHLKAGGKGGGVLLPGVA